MNKTILAQEDRDKLIIEMYVNKEMPMYKIAEQLNIAVGTVFNVCQKTGIITRPQRSGYFKGKTHTQEACEKISKANKGKIVSQETREKLSKAKKKGGIGHKKKRTDGYIYIYFPDHPKSTKEGYIMEHDLIMECLIGRRLESNEVVHHKDGQRDNNIAENLELMTSSEHTSMHARERHKSNKEE